MAPETCQSPSGTLIEVEHYGALPDDGLDDSKAILAAFDAAADIRGPVRIRFGAGRYRLSEVIHIERGNIVLQGAGSGRGGTTIWIPRPLAQVDTGNSLDEIRQYIRELDKRQVEPNANIDSYYSEYSWTGGFHLGTETGHPARTVPDRVRSGNQYSGTYRRWNTWRTQSAIDQRSFIFTW